MADHRVDDIKEQLHCIRFREDDLLWDDRDLDKSEMILSLLFTYWLAFDTDVERLVTLRCLQNIDFLWFVPLNHIFQGHKLLLFLRKELINVYREDFFVQNVSFAYSV